MKMETCKCNCINKREASSQLNYEIGVMMYRAIITETMIKQNMIFMKISLELQKNKMKTLFLMKVNYYVDSKMNIEM